jgi:hypothetical protein
MYGEEILFQKHVANDWGWWYGLGLRGARDGGIWRLISRWVRLLELFDGALIIPAALAQNTLRLLSSLPAND